MHLKYKVDEFWEVYHLCNQYLNQIHCISPDN